jgi:anti-sigma B factor antagonist
MDLVVVDHDTGTKLVTLTGRLDAPGVEQVETRFTAAVVPAQRHVLVDLSGVSFVGSLGLRMLISVARTMQRRGHKLVLFGIDPLVRSVFDSVALADLIPLATDREQAALLLAA